MPDTALKHLSKKAKISFGQAEHYWHVASNIVKKEYDVDENDAKYWALTMGIAKKMMGLKESLSFKDFLYEKPVDKFPTLTHLDVEAAVETLNTHCKNAIWMLEQDRPFYRGDKGGYAHDLSIHSGFGIMDSSKTERVSQNTSNYYTLIFDNIPSMNGFPKRSRSFIMSNDLRYARKFVSGNDEKLMVCIPFDDAKIGIVGSEDMWDINIRVFGSLRDVADVNDSYEDIGLSDTNWESFINFDKALKNDESAAFEDFKNAFGEIKAQQFKRSFIEEINKGYAPSSTGFIKGNTSSIKSYSKNSEVWVGGRVLLMTVDMWNKIREKFNA